MHLPFLPLFVYLRAASFKLTPTDRILTLRFFVERRLEFQHELLAAYVHPKKALDSVYYEVDILRILRIHARITDLLTSIYSGIMSDVKCGRDISDFSLIQECVSAALFHHFSTHSVLTTTFVIPSHLLLRVYPCYP